MKILIDKAKPPTIYVKITDEEDNNNNSYINFMNLWKLQYDKKIRFNFFFDFQELTRPNLNLLNNFIARYLVLKNYQTQYLDFSIVIIKNKFISYILHSIWKLNPPLSDVYLVSNKNQAEELLNYLNNPIYDRDFIKAYSLCNNITQI